MATIDLVRAHLNPRLALKGVLLTMHDGRTSLSADVTSEVRRHLGDQVFRTVVPRSVRLAEAPSYGQPIAQYSPASEGRPGVPGRDSRAAGSERLPAGSGAARRPWRDTRVPGTDRETEGRPERWRLKPGGAAAAWGAAWQSLIPRLLAGRIVDQGGARRHRVQPHPEQPRRTFDPEELCSSWRIRSLQSACCSPSSSRRAVTASPSWPVSVGCARPAMAGLATIPAIVRNANEQEQLEIALVENIQRAGPQRGRGGARLPAPHGRLRPHPGAGRPARRALASGGRQHPAYP